MSARDRAEWEKHRLPVWASDLLTELIDEQEAQLAAALGALRETRPYVFQRIFPPGHPQRDWRAELAEVVLARVDDILSAAEERRKRGTPS